MASRVCFILVDTLAPGNVGRVCRIAKAFGFPDVRLVSPRFEPEELTASAGEAQRFARGAEELLEQVSLHSKLVEAGDDCHRLIATTGRRRDWSRRVLSPRDLAQEIADGDASESHGLVFGPEDHGLTNESLAFCDEIVSIPLPPIPCSPVTLPPHARQASRISSLACRTR